MTNDTDLWAEFDELMREPDPDPANAATSTTATTPATLSPTSTDTPPPPASTADPLDQADQPSADVVPIDEARARKNTASKARALVDSSLALAQQAIDSGEADFDDAIKAINVAHRVLEHTDKMEAQQRAGGTRCIVHFNFVRPTADKPGTLSIVTQDVVDVDATEVQAQADDLAEGTEAAAPVPTLTTPVDIKSLFASVQS